MRIIGLVVFMFFSFTALKAQLSGNYSIDVNGSGTRNFKTISAAVDSLERQGISDTVHFQIANGYYNERIQISEINGAGSKGRIIFDGASPDSVTVSYSSYSSSERATWFLDGADYLIIRNLTIEAVGTFRSSIHFAKGANYNEVENCVLKCPGSNPNYRNVVFAASNWAAGKHGNYNTIANCDIEGGFYGLFIYGQGLGGNNHNQGNIFVNLDFKNVYYYGVYNYYNSGSFFINLNIEPTYNYGVSFYNYYAYQNNIDSCQFKAGRYGLYDYYGKYNRIRKCRFSNQLNDNVYSFYADFETYIENDFLTPNYYNLYTYGNKKLTLFFNNFKGGNKYTYYNWANYYGQQDSVYGNTFSKAEFYNLLIYSNENSWYVNNMVYGDLPGKNNFEANIHLYQADSCKLYHNTLYNKGGGGTFQGNNAYTVPTNIFNSESKGVRLVNNILVYDGAYQAGANLTNLNGTFSALDHNVYESKRSVYIDNSTAYSSLLDWQKANLKANKLSYEAISNFVDRANGDLHLDSNYSAYKGVAIGVWTDIDRNNRCYFGPTIGADESKYPVVKPTAGFVVDDTVYLNSPTLILNQNANKLGHQHSWGVNGNSAGYNDNLEYTFTKRGNYRISLNTRNCGGTDTFSKVVFADTSTRKPTANYIVNTTTINAGDQVQFTDISNNGPTKWEWIISPDSIFDGLMNATVLRYEFQGGSTSNSRHPKIKFNYPGQYTISLKAGNSAGTDTIIKVDILLVKASTNMCSFPDFSNVPSGTLHDDGGDSKNYSNNQSCGFLLDPCASQITLTFSEFDLETGFDYLRIYDGVNNTGKPLWDISTYGGNGLTGRITSANFDSVFIAESGKMYIEMETDPFNSSSGFKATWTSIKGNYGKPKALFSIDDTVCVDQLVNFENQTGGDVRTFHWSFGVNKQSQSSFVNPSYTYTKPGTYDVVLTATGCAGTDTMHKQVVVQFPSSSPSGDFVADLSRPTITDEVRLIPETEYCVTNYEWIISPDTGFKYLAGTNDSSQFPVLNFYTKGKYSVSLVITNIATTDTIKKLDYIEVVSYCAPTATANLSDIGISKVSIEGETTLEKSSTANPSVYSNYTNSAADVEIGKNYRIIVSRLSNNNRVKRTVWADWNQDGKFDTTELVANEPKGGTYNLDFNVKFTVPVNAKIGGTRIRISSSIGNAQSNPCGGYRYGEFEDYRLFVRTDQTKPIITLNGDDTVYVSQCSNYTDSGAVVCDNIGGCSYGYTQAGSVNTSKEGLYKLKFTAVDSSSNQADPKVRWVSVLPDFEAPSIALNGPDTVLVIVNGSYNDLGITTSDACVTPSVNQVGSVSTSKLGTYRLTYYSSDGTNTSSIDRIVLVIDTLAPEIVLVDGDTLIWDVFDEFKDPGITISDNYYTKADLQIQSNGAVDFNTLGEYRIQYEAKDPSGNTSGQIYRIVKVIDRKAPEVFLKGPDTVVLEVNNQYYDLLAEGVDQHDGDLGFPKKQGSFYDYFPNGVATKIGSFNAEYVFTDKSGNTAKATRVIYVVDSEAPVIRLKGGNMVTLCRWEEFEDLGFEVEDNYDVEPVVIKDESSYSNSSPGEYFITYYAEDQSGNKSTIATRRITVIECNNSIEHDNLANVIEVYPNPSSGQFIIISSKIRVNQLVVYNLQGKEILRSSFSNQIDLKPQSSGVYYLGIETNSGRILKKIVLSK